MFLIKEKQNFPNFSIVAPNLPSKTKVFSYKIE